MKTGFIMGMIFIILIAMVGGVVYASPDQGPKQCPPGQRGNCSWYQQNTTGKYGCFPNNANLGNGWVKVSNECPSGKEEKKDPTATAKPEIVATNTPVPKPTDTPVEIYTGKKDKSGKEIVVVGTTEQLVTCPEDCVCKLLEDIAWELDELGELLNNSNMLQLTAIAVDQERNDILRGE